MNEEYRAITDAGYLLQIDDPDLADAWQIHAEMDVQTYRRFAELRVESINVALEGVPRAQVRLHVCWGSIHGPHKNDIPLRDIADLILKVNAGVYSIEASNPRHEHEWRVWEDFHLPQDSVLMPGVVGHASDFVEHPELVAERIVRYAGVVGRENVIAGTDCGLGGRVGHENIVWAKFEALAEVVASRLASSGRAEGETVLLRRVRGYNAVARTVKNPAGGELYGQSASSRATNRDEADGRDQERHQ
jgi:5-methyltetrahydropteroyltriglutamate--homocysteine methyltransferase